MNVVMLLDNPFVNDLRVYREAKSIVEGGHQLTLYALSSAGLPTNETIEGINVKRIFNSVIFDIKKPITLKRQARRIVNDMEAQGMEIDVLHCHDQTMLEIGSLIKNANKKIQLIYDSHEMFHAWPLNLSATGGISLFIKSYVVRKLQIRRELNNARYIDYLITVSTSIAERLKHYFQLRREPVVIRNMPYYQASPKKQNRIRTTFSISPETKLLVFIAGNLYVNSQNLAQLIDEVGNQELALVIISGSGHGKRYFQEYVSNAGITNVYFHDRVPPHEIVDYLAECDIGVLPYWNKKDLSYWYALPNKLFDYIMAELPVLSTAQPEFEQLINSSEIGVCINPEEEGAFLSGYQALLANWSNYANNAIAAKANFNWEKEEERLKALYREISLGKSSHE